MCRTEFKGAKRTKSQKKLLPAWKLLLLFLTILMINIFKILKFYHLQYPRFERPISTAIVRSNGDS